MGGVTLSEVAGSYFPVKRRGSQFWACCPFHAERSPSFCINDEKGVYKCWGCGAGGSTARFVMEMDKISFPEAIRKLGAIAGIPVVEEESEYEKATKALYAANENAFDFFFESLLGPAGKSARAHLRSRGFNREICEAWGIGYAPESYVLKGDETTLLRSGLIYDGGTPRFRDRIMFSIRNESGSLAGFSGRALGDHPAKYLNSPDSTIFSKGKILFGLNKAKSSVMESGEIVLVEGQIDAIRCHLAGITNAVAPMGTAFTDAHGSTIRRLCGSAILVFDGDKAGLEASRKAYAGLSSKGVDTRAVFLPDKKDPDDFILGGGNLALAIAEAKLYPEALAQHLPSRTPEEKLSAIKQVGFAVSRLQDGITRDDMTVRLAKVIGVAPNDLGKYVAMAGGHDAMPTTTVMLRGEGVRFLMAHLLYCGKAKAMEFDWSLIDDPAIKGILDSDYIAGNEASIASVLGKLDGSVEASVSGVSKSDRESVDIRSVYRALLDQAVKRKAEEVASSGEIDKLIPLIDALKRL